MHKITLFNMVQVYRTQIITLKVRMNFDSSNHLQPGKIKPTFIVMMLMCTFKNSFYTFVTQFLHLGAGIMVEDEAERL